ncbi:MAG: hypothetical protein HKO64_12350 [Xanthomonadales bacterium]|nr:hypothetical protein [Xanthomonadales bacterium]
MVGGVGEAVPVHVQQGTDTFNCYSSREIAKELGRFLFTTEIRVYGTGRWIIDENENWELKRFNISRFEVLDNVKLREVIQRLRNIENSGIAELEDPWQKLSELRQDRIREG